MSDPHDALIKKAAVWYDEENEIWNYRASGIGQCFSALVMARLELENEDFPQWLLEKMDDSSNLEDEALFTYITDEAYAGITQNVSYRVEQQVQIVLTEDGADWQVLGHCDAKMSYFKPDAEVVNNTEFLFERLIEIKSPGEVLFNNFSKGREYISETYKWQISCYMYATGLPLDLYIFPKAGHGGPNLGVDPIVYSYDPGEQPITIEEIRDRIEEIERVAEIGIPPECHGIQFPCAYFKYHIKPPKDTLVVTESDTEDSDDYIRELVIELSQTKEEELLVKKKLAAITQDRKNLENELFEWKRQHGDPKVVRASGYEVEEIKSFNRYPDWERIESELNIKKADYEKQVFYSYSKVRAL